MNDITVKILKTEADELAKEMKKVFNSVPDEAATKKCSTHLMMTPDLKNYMELTIKFKKWLKGLSVLSKNEYMNQLIQDDFDRTLRILTELSTKHPDIFEEFKNAEKSKN